MSTLAAPSLDVQKIQRLKSITHEVNDFHPLLHRLLRKLPGVRRVEKTHGTLEHGADFVLEREDLAIEIPVVCAVIAKSGNINKPESHRVIEQVRECHGERLFWSGKQKVSVDEIWVTTSGVIAEAAKRMIHDEFKASKIQFLDRDQLIRLIDKYLQSYWSDIDVSVGDYLSDLAHEVEREDRELSLLPNIEASFYVEQDIFRFGKRITSFRVGHLPQPEKVNLLEELEQNRLILVEGDAGSGKSKCSRELIRSLCDAKRYNQRHVIPMRVPCSELFEHFEGKLDKLVEDRLSHHRDILADRQNSFLVIADGLDELKQSGEQAKEQVRLVADQVEANPALRAIILSRPFSTDFGESVSFERTVRLELQPLSLTKTIIFLKKLCSDLAPSSRVFEDLKKSALFHQLPRTPIATILLARILREKHVDLPSSLPELYRKYFELALGRWDIDRGLQSEKEYEALNSILMDISDYLMENQVEGITYDEALTVFKDYLGTRNFGLAPEELLQTASSRCPILRVSKGDNRFSFKHRTFAEFLFAKKAHEHLGRAPKFAKVTAKAFDPYWLNSVYFYIGLQRDCPELLEQLIDFPTTGGIDVWLKTFNLSDFLLAGYATPYGVIIRGLKEAAVTLSKLYSEMVSSAAKYEVDNLPQMQLLWMVQYFFKHRYGYGFFEKAIPEAVQDIVMSGEDKETKAFAVYFLSVAYKELGGKDNFDFLLTDELSPLPLPIDLALTLETKDLKTKSTALKRYEKHVREMMRKDPKLHRQMERLFKRPMSSASGKVNDSRNTRARLSTKH